ncbi:MAG: dTMP kinase [Gemmatimonadota bacterium]
MSSTTTDADRGLFIVLEGPDGAGKTTQAALLSGWFEALGLTHVATREPGGTAVGEAIRSVVLGRTDLEMPPESELLLILAARAAFVAEVVRPALDAGTTVLADRFSLSTLAYQGYGRGLNLDRVRRGIEISTDGLEPDLYLVLDVPVEEGRARQLRSGQEEDRIEQAGLDFRRAVRDGYLELADGEAAVEVIDGRGSPDDVHQELRKRLTARFPDRFGAGRADSVR